MSSNSTLAGKTIVVTRPLAQAQQLMETLEAQQARTIHFPVIKICGIENIDSAKHQFIHLSKFQTVIFISANAVHYALPLIKELNAPLANCNLAAVGPATKLALESHGYSVDIVPKTGFNSEALLADPNLEKVSKQDILIVRGQGGREHLRQTLVSRGACVEYAEVYRRQMPENRNPIDLSQLATQNCAILLYSVESAQNLWSLCTQDEQHWLQAVTFIVASERIAKASTRVGYANNPIIAKATSDQAMLNALVDWSINPCSPHFKEYNNNK